MYPSDVLLPGNAKYYGLIDNKMAYNSHRDIVWSFSFALTGTEHGFVTFLTNIPTLTGGIPGHRLGYLGNTDYIKDENGNILLGEDGYRLTYDPYPLSTYETMGVLGIAFDTTGYFALSSSTYDGVGISQCVSNSIVVRDSNDNLVYNSPLSSLDTTFFLTSSVKHYQTLRFRLTNAGRKLYVEKWNVDKFNTLTSIPISSFNASSNDNLYVGFTYCSPISSSSTTPSTLYLKNLHTQGSYEEPTYEIAEFTSIYPSVSNTFTTIDNIL